MLPFRTDPQCKLAPNCQIVSKARGRFRFVGRARIWPKAEIKLQGRRSRATTRLQNVSKLARADWVWALLCVGCAKVRPPPPPSTIAAVTATASNTAAESLPPTHHHHCRNRQHHHRVHRQHHQSFSQKCSNGVQVVAGEQVRMLHRYTSSEAPTCSMLQNAYMQQALRCLFVSTKYCTSTHLRSCCATASMSQYCPEHVQLECVQFPAPQQMSCCLSFIFVPITFTIIILALNGISA